MVRRHHPKDREQRLELKHKLEEVPKKRPRGIRGKIKDAIKDRETSDDLFEYSKQRDIDG